MFKGLIKRPIAVTMVLIAVMVLGIAAICKLPVSLVPDINVPQITVQVQGFSIHEPLSFTMVA